MAFKIPFMHDYKNKLRKTQAEIILNNVNHNLRGTGQKEGGHRTGLNFAAVRPTTVQRTNCKLSL
jgi:hypothetical protein